MTTRRKPRDRPLLIVLTGHGKGKSTSAFGMLMRSWARGYRCGVFQFVKSGKWNVGEAKAGKIAGDHIRRHRKAGTHEFIRHDCGRQRLTINQYAVAIEDDHRVLRCLAGKFGH